mmetsp:Transcript_33969/g.97709  ORF Transcript_33969/g.97709 Transcript_33969/m.97709 type:complete len:198 (+) Transcript_33969:54-647(+)
MVPTSAAGQTGLVWRSEPRSSGKYLAPATAKPKAPVAPGSFQRASGGGNRGTSAGLHDVPVLDVLDDIASAICDLRQSVEEKEKLSQELDSLRERIQDAPDGEYRCFNCRNTNWVDRPCCKRCGELRADMAMLRKVQGLKQREKRMSQEGKGGGLFDRQAVDKKEWNSDDEELDEFGRKKRRRRGPGEPEARTKRRV